MSKEKKIRLSGYIPESVNDKVVTRNIVTGKQKQSLNRTN